MYPNEQKTLALEPNGNFVPGGDTTNDADGEESEEQRHAQPRPPAYYARSWPLLDSIALMVK